MVDFPARHVSFLGGNNAPKTKGGLRSSPIGVFQVPKMEESSPMFQLYG